MRFMTTTQRIVESLYSIVSAVLSFFAFVCSIVIVEPWVPYVAMGTMIVLIVPAVYMDKHWVVPHQEACARERFMRLHSIADQCCGNRVRKD